MFNRRTLFIVGAGASAEVDFPTGPQLARNIGDRLDFTEGTKTGDRELLAKLREHYQPQTVIPAALRIRDGIVLSPSIDEFLDIHKDDPDVQKVGKPAIARAILNAERESKLFIDSKNGQVALDTRAVVDTWYVRLMHMLSVGIAKKDVHTITNSVSFVVFNYDRCLEHFLFHALQQQYAVSPDEAHDILQSTTIIHPYGTVGELDTDVDRSGVPFGGLLLQNDDYVRRGKTIKTFAEAASDEISLSVRDEVSKASCIVFLGFGFHKANMSLLTPGKLLDQIPIFATAYKTSDSNVESVKNDLGAMCKKVPRINGSDINPFIYVDANLKCAQLLDAYSRKIQGGV